MEGKYLKKKEAIAIRELKHFIEESKLDIEKAKLIIEQNKIDIEEYENEVNYLENKFNKKYMNKEKEKDECSNGK